MSSRSFLRPETAIAKAEEFVRVGKPSRALDTLYEVIKSKKRSHSYSENTLEKLMYKYLELCIDLKKAYIAKEGLYQYRNICQTTNVASLAAVIQFYLTGTEKRTEAAQKESKDLVDVDDLDNLNTPEVIMLRAVSGEDAQDRTDRTVLIPWVKFLWESYLQCLELLRANSRVERLYHDVAQQALRFCLKYQRRTEFRMLCEKIRSHLDIAMKRGPSAMSLDLNSLETQQLNLDTRLLQLDFAIQMELWHEAYKAVEDIHGLMTISKKNFQPKTMSNYYQKLALVFWKSGYHLFHATAILKHFQLSREMKKNLSPEELGKMASRVVLAVIATPLSDPRPEFDQFIEMDCSPQDKMARLSLVLGLTSPPTRASLINDVCRFGILQAALPEMQNLYHHLEIDFDPLKLCHRVQSFVNHVEKNEDLSFLRQYIPTLKDITLVRLIKQVSQLYKSICFNRLLELAPFTSPFALERTIVECARFNFLQVRIDHRTRTLRFGTELTETMEKDDLDGPQLQDMPSEQIRAQLMVMNKVLNKSVQVIAPEKIKNENNLLRRKIIEAYHNSKVRDHERILLRQKAIENRKEYLEKKAYELAVEEESKKEMILREQQILEEKRLQAEREAREKRKQEEEIRQIQQRHIQEKVNQIKQTDIGKKVLNKLDEEEIANLDTDQIMAKQVFELERERKELISRLKSQDKKIDHFERAKRQEEIPLLQKQFEEDLEEDKVFWANKEENRIIQAKEDRKVALEHQSRLSRMKEDKNEYLSNLLKERRSDFEKKCAEFDKYLEAEKKKRLAARKKMREAERREKWINEKKAEEQRRMEEEMQRLEMERLMKEEEAWLKKKAELDAIEDKKRLREKEIEEKMKIEEAKCKAPNEETSNQRSMDSNNWRNDRAIGRDNRGPGRDDHRDMHRRDGPRDGFRKDDDFRRNDRRDDFSRDDFRRNNRRDDFSRDDLRRNDRRDDFSRDDFRRNDRRDDFNRDDLRRNDRRDDFSRDDFRRNDRRDDFNRDDLRRNDRRDDFSRDDLRRNDRRDDFSRDDFRRNDRRDNFGRDDRRDNFARDGLRDGLRRDDHRDDFGRDGRRDNFRRDGRRDEFRRGDRDPRKSNNDRGQKSDAGSRSNNSRGDLQDNWRRDGDKSKNNNGEDSEEGWTTVKR